MMADESAGVNNMARYNGRADLVDFAVECEINVLSEYAGSSTRVAQIGFRARNDGLDVNSRWFGYQFGGVLHLTDGDYTTVKLCGGAVSTGVWHHYRVEVAGQRIQAWFDGKKVHDKQDVAMSANGSQNRYVGFRGSRTKALYRNFAVYTPLGRAF